MVQTRGGPARGTAAATASMRRRKATNGNNTGGAGTAASMLQFYARDASTFKVSPEVVIGMSIGFIACVVLLHVMSKFYLVR